MKNISDMISIIQNDELIPFILGYDPYSFQYPEDGYRQWRKLITYFEDSSTPSDIKKKIRETVINLIDAPDIASKVASLTLSEKMELHEIKEKIIDVVRRGAYDSWEEYAKRQLLITAAHFQVTEIEEFLAKSVVQNGSIANFIQWSKKRLEEQYVGQDDLWKVTILAKYYEDVNPAIQNSIINQLVSSARQWPRIQNILNMFVAEKSEIFSEFCARIKNRK